MCELCSVPDSERHSALEARAKLLERLALLVREVGSGKRRLHTYEMDAVTQSAHGVIRWLVEDYL